jgi:hypothetical protein
MFLKQEIGGIVILFCPFQLTRSISTSGNAAGNSSALEGGGVVVGGPGSPYHRSTSGSLNGLAFSTRPNLNKELMQKLRSMTETIKMLSDENQRLKGDNEGLRDELESVAKAGVVRRTARNSTVATVQLASLGDRKSGGFGLIYRCH